MKENWKVRKKKQTLKHIFTSFESNGKSIFKRIFFSSSTSSISHVYNNDFEIREIHRNEKRN